MKKQIVRLILLILAVFFLTTRKLPAQESAAADSTRVRQILIANCYRCHGQNGSKEGGFDYVLDFKKLVKNKVRPGDPAKSRLYKRMGAEDMPPEEEKQRPSKAEIEIVRKWIAAGAPEPAAEVTQQRLFLELGQELSSIRTYLRKLDREDRKYVRFFSLRHLHNMPSEKIRHQDLTIYRPALSKLVNSLSWKHAIVLPDVVDKHQTLFAVDIRRLDWDRHGLWQEIIRLYPYGLKHDFYPEDRRIKDLTEDIYDMTGTTIPVVRIDWFIAAASRPPLYHTLLHIPATATELERILKVDVYDNFTKARLARAGFSKSGVSGHNRLVERHEGLHGAYWKSYDFKSSAGSGNLFIFPLGPRFNGNPYNRHAFKHDGGEIIFNLPNGLQAYMLVDGNDKRIDIGPVEVVNDSKKTSGTPQIVNGLSCMACHKNGMIPFKDEIRSGHILGGDTRELIRRLYVEAKDMAALLDQDKKRYLRPLEKAMRPFLKDGPYATTELTDLPDPISAIGRWYLSEEMTLLEAARELGLKDEKRLQTAIENNRRLQLTGLYPLARGNNIKREVWETLEFFTSPFQDAARELKLGTPVRHQ